MQERSYHAGRLALVETVGLLEIWERALPGSRTRSMIAASRARLEWFARREFGDRWAAPEEGEYHLRTADGMAFCGGQIGAQSPLAPVCGDCLLVADLFDAVEVKRRWASDDVAGGLDRQSEGRRR